jgi:hypothetical protein
VAKLTRLTHKIAIQLHLVAESYTICSSNSKRPFRKLLDTHSYTLQKQPGTHTHTCDLGCRDVFNILGHCPTAETYKGTQSFSLVKNATDLETFQCGGMRASLWRNMEHHKSHNTRNRQTCAKTFPDIRNTDGALPHN